MDWLKDATKDRNDSLTVPVSITRQAPTKPETVSIAEGITRHAAMDPRFGGQAVGRPEVKGQGPQPAAPYDPTIGDFIRDRIAEMHAQIKQLELQYHEARTLGILDKKVHAVRQIIGW